MNETLDWDAPASIRTATELDAEVRRLAAKRPPLDAPPAPRRRPSIRLDDWMVRRLDAAPEDPAAATDDGFGPVVLPHTALAAFTHFRCTFDVAGALGESPVLHVGAADYEAFVHLDGVLVGTHRGYFAPFEVPLPAAEHGRHQLDIVVRRAVDYVTWDGTDSAENFGDAHGKGLGSVCEGIPTAGCGLLAPVRLEARAAARIRDAFAGSDGADVVVSVELEGAVMAGSEVVVRVGEPGGVAVVDGRAEVRGSGTAELRLPGAGLRRWTPLEPALYDVTIELVEHGTVLDELVQRTGFRTMERATDGSLRLNGEPLYLRGTTTVGDLWEAAWGGDRRTVVERMLQVKALNANVLRVHVSVLPPLAYECADEVGLLIYQDAPLQWHCFEPVADELSAEVDQIEELVRLVRSHPSVIVLSFPNEMHMWEPFHDSDVRFIELAAERAGEVRNGLVLVQDHSGGTRPTVIPQSFHEYPGYFDGTSGNVDSIITVEGEGTKAVISEFGAGGMPSWAAFSATAAAHRADGEPFPLPSEPGLPWPAELARTHVIGGTMDLLQRSVGRRGTFEEYRAASQAHQARVVSRQTGRIRRDREHTSGLIHHYFRQPTAHLYNSWFDLAIVDIAGEPTSAFDALRTAYRPVAMELLGAPERTFVGATVSSEVWVYNDLAEAVAVEVAWTVDGSDGVVDAGRLAADVSAHSSARIGSIAVDGARLPVGASELRAELSIGGRAWAADRATFRVDSALPAVERTVAVVGDVDGLVERAGAWLSDVRVWAPGDRSDVVLVTPGVELPPTMREQLVTFVGEGGRLVLLERPSGEDLGWLSPAAVAIVANDLASELAHVEFSLVDSGLTTDDLSRWPTRDGRVVTFPVLGADTRLSPGWASTGIRLQYWAVQEFKYRYGSTVVCQAHVWDCARLDPAAAALLRHTITKPARVIA